MATRRALIVATSEYEDDQLRRLRAPGADAEALARVLGDDQLGGFQVEVAADATEGDLRRRLTAFFLRTAQRDDVVLAHFSCHGVLDERGDLYFATTDTRKDDLYATAIEAAWLQRLLRDSNSRQIMLLLDCCHSGAFARGGERRAGSDVHLKQRLDGKGWVVITATDVLEYAWEGDELTGDGQPSVFTRAVVDGIETGAADIDRDGQISVDDLYEFVDDTLQTHTRKQTPTKFGSVQGQLFVSRARAHQALQASDRLPDEVIAAIRSPFAGLRGGGARELARLLHVDDALSSLAGNELNKLLDDDSRDVSEVASCQAARRREATPQAAGIPWAVGGRPPNARRRRHPPERYLPDDRSGYRRGGGRRSSPRSSRCLSGVGRNRHGSGDRGRRRTE